jgi:F0F1-type ATP synthase membrane subunit b/b'
MPQILSRSSGRLGAHISVLSVALFFGAPEAFASGGEGHAPSVWDLRFLWLNFGLYVALLYFLLRKVVASGWEARRQRVEKSVVSATTEMQSAEKELRSIEDMVRELKTEQEKARAEVLTLAKEEAASIVRAAEERASRIRSQAKDLLTGERRSAEASFRGALVARAVELARSKFSSGQYTSRQDAYVAAAVDRAKRLVQ